MSLKLHIKSSPKVLSALLLIGLFVLVSLLSSTAQNTQPVYRFSADILAEIQQDTVPWKYQLGANALSFSLHARQVMEVWDQNRYRPAASAAADSNLLVGRRWVSARQWVLEQAQEAPMLLLNEAHHLGQHRVFTQSLLADLYAQGYRYLGLEALSDSSINERKFAVRESGYYTQSPDFGNLIHEALQIGYQLFGYEADPTATGPAREQQQAENIYQFMQQQPNGKVLIHCGYAHAYESDYKPWGKAMAGRLKELTGLDPLTVDQTQYLERANAEHTPWLMRFNRKGRSMVLVDAEGKAFRGPETPAQTDAVIIHPPITYFLDGRPVWWMLDKSAYEVNCQLLGEYQEVLVLAYRRGEELRQGIPADVVEWSSSTEKGPVLWLKPGAYVLELQDRNYQVISRSELLVE